MSKLRRDVDTTRSAIESLLDDYGLFIDHDMAGVISSYVRALHLDFELALSAGRSEELARILEDMLELHSDTRDRLLKGRLQTGMASPLES
ncbi:MAG: hypothetical protein WD314_05610 [Trueperaceae bacterium]